MLDQLRMHCCWNEIGRLQDTENEVVNRISKASAVLWELSLTVVAISEVSKETKLQANKGNEPGGMSAACLLGDYSQVKASRPK